MNGRALRRAAWTALAAALLPASAFAHLVNSGLGPFYDGMGHFVLTPEDLLPVTAMALLAGQRGPDAARRALFALPVAWLLAGLAGLTIRAGFAAPTLAATTFVAMGGMVAAEAPLPRGWIAGVAAAIGLLHGYLNGAALSQAKLGTVGLLGIVAILFALVALASALVVAIRAPSARIAVRVAGSWIAAIGLLLFGWSLRAR